MYIRRAENKDIPKISNLLSQVLNVHHEARPDIFKSDTVKYYPSDLEVMIKSDNDPIFVCVSEDELVVGYAFCKIIDQNENNILHARKTLYIDDLCVDQSLRGKRIGQTIFDYVKEYAKTIGCNDITLNVWSDNVSAVKFYEKMGMRPQKQIMEYKLS